MDFSTLLKGATDTLKKLDPEVKSDSNRDAAWSGWANAEDDWEDVADVADVGPPSAPTTTTFQDKSTQGTPTQETNEDATVNGTVANSQPPSHDAAKSLVDPSSDSSASSKHDAELRDLRDRLATAERKLFAVSRDRDALRRVKDNRSADAELVKDKDKQIKAVLAEGELLSVRIAEKEGSIRSLRAAAREREAALEELRLSLSATEMKLEAAASRQRQLETSEKSSSDAVEAAEKRMRQIESEARSNSSSSAALEAARAQLESMRKNQAAALENQAMRLSAENDAALETVQNDASQKEEALNKAMAELRAHLTQVVDNAGWREDQLRKEADELRKRAEQLEARNEELAAALPDATRPLLRQVEALQAAASERARAKSAVDKSQLDRLRATEAAVATAAERERAAEERIGSLLAKIAALEEQVRLGQVEHGRLAGEIRKVSAKEAESELRHQRELDELQATVLKATRDRERAQEDLSRERASHLDASEASDDRERQLRSQLAAVETRLDMVQEHLAKAQAGSISRSPSTLPRFDSTGNVSSASLGVGSDFGEEEPGTPSGVYGIERLTQSLRQRNGEISSLQAQLEGKESATNALAEEVVSLTAKVDELAKEIKDAPERKREFAVLTERHTALLEMLGERQERIMELEADLSDVNQIYKEQITELLLRIEKLST